MNSEIKKMYVIVCQKKFNKDNFYKVFTSNSLELVERKLKSLPKIRGRKYVVQEVICRKAVTYHV